jgi:predicted DNA-binding transcriptional regulator YafY
MSYSVKIKRYLLILNYLVENKKPTLKQIHKHIHSYDLECSPRTLQRDLSDLRNEFGIEIVVDKIDNSYSINYDESENINDALRLFKISNSAQVMIETINEGKNTLKYLSLDSSENLTGIELMEPLITALKTKQVITFNHFSFQTEETKLITLHPYLLKEYKNRWFLFGENDIDKKSGIYGIERISNLVLTGNYFVPKADYDPKTNFKNVIGIATRPFISGLPEQDFTLTMTEEQGRYFKTLPWHPNHEILVDNKDEFRVKLHLLPNYEFMQILYQYCDKVTVLEPQWLRDHLKKIFKASSNKY